MLITRPLRWFLLVWVGLMYCGGIWDLLGVRLLDPAFAKCWGLFSQFSEPRTTACFPPHFLLPQQLDLWPACAFTGLILSYSILFWKSFERFPRRPWLAFLLQAGMVFAIGLIVRQENVVLGLSLSLTIAAISMFQDTRVVVITASGALSLFLLTMLLNRGPGEDWPVTLFKALTSTDIPALGLFLMGYLALYVQQARAHTTLAAAHLQLQAAASRIEALTRLTERRRLARELHDTLAQGLVGLALQLETADGLLTWGRSGQAQEIVQQALARARATLTEARDAIDDLRAEQAEELVFLKVVSTEIDHLTSASGLDCHTDLEMLATLDPLLQEPVLRVIAEGVTNVVRHAHAHHIWVRFMQEGQAQTIEVRDDGRGFDPSAKAARQGHYGLIGLRERAQLLGGQLELASTMGKGTTIRFSFPRHPGGPRNE